MRASDFDDEAFFATLDREGLRVLVIGRFAMVALGAPLLTADSELWCDPDAIESLNRVGADFELYPTATPDDARSRGRYVLEGDEHVDVMVARSKTTIEGTAVRFDDLWTHHEAVVFRSTRIHVPSLEGLLATKKFADRPKDREDRLWLEALAAKAGR